jgi:hypothetical protein
MKPITVISLIVLHFVVGFFAIGVARTEFGAPPEFPYGFLLVVSLVPTIMSASASGGRINRLIAWVVGVGAVMVIMIGLRPMIVRALAWSVVEGTGPMMPEVYLGIWAAFAAGTALIAALATWAILRRETIGPAQSA